MDLSDLACKCKEDYPQPDLYWSTSLAGEVGEWCNLIKKDHHPDKKITDLEEEDEIADVFIYWVLLARSRGYGVLSLQEIVERKLRKLGAIE